jgi:DNA-directed RNA polymerase specialized sigma24 family protein
VRADPDYTAWVVARWAPVVRMLVLLGLPVADAEDRAATALARMLPDWGRLRHEGDADVELARTVLDVWLREKGGPSEQPVAVPVPAGLVVTRELEDQLALLKRLSDGLGGLDATTRVTVVLHHLGELDVAQVSDVLGTSQAEVGRRLREAAVALDLVPLDPACHSAANAIDVPPPNLARIEARAHAGRRKRWLVTGAAVVALAMVAGGAYALTRPDPSDAMQALDVTPVENPVGVAWWLDGTLHLDHGTTRVPHLRHLVDSGVGVVYGDDDGHVVAVAEDGTRELIGTMDVDTPLVSSPRLGFVAWLEPSGGDLVTWDLVTRRRLGSTGRTQDTALIGWDRDRLYFHRDGADHMMTTSGTKATVADVETPEGAEGSAIKDVSSGAELRLNHGALSIVQPFFNVSIGVPGTDGQLSPDGNYALTHVGDGSLAVYDSRSGDPMGTWFDRSWSPVAAAFTLEGRAVWVVDTGDGSYGMFDCQVSKRFIDSFYPETEPCTERLDIGALPLLAGTEPGLVTQT